MTESRTLLITGASRGIGRTTATLFAEHGYDVAVNYSIDLAGATRTAEAVRAFGKQAILVKADVSKPMHVKRMVKDTVKSFGRIDVLVNNAAVQPKLKFDEIDEQTWDRTIDVNLKGAFLCSKAVIPLMKEERGGRIIFVSSVAARTGGIIGAHYASSKAGMLGLTHYLANDLGRFNILVNAVAPAFIGDAGSIAQMSQRERKELAARVPLGRLGNSTDVARTILFLAENDFMTGQTIDVNGGLWIG